MMKLFQPSKYGSVKKITDYGNTEFVENYLSDWLDKQVIKWKSIPVLRKQMEGLKEYGLEEIKKGMAHELGLFIERSFEIGGVISTPSNQKIEK